MLLSYIEERIARLQRPTIISINGAITSGKTTLSKELEQYLKGRGYATQLVCVDDFHTPRAVRMKDGSIFHYYEHAIDLQQLGDLLSDMKREPVNRTLTLLDMNTDTYVNSQTYRTDMNTIIIVEGVFLHRPPIAQLFDYRIYLDVSDEEIMRRGRERDVPKFGEQILAQYESFYIPLQRLYEELCAPKDQCDLVIDTNKQPPFIVSPAE